MPASAKINIEILEQEISEQFELAEAVAFMKAEAAWYVKHQQLLSENFVVNNQNHGDPQVYRAVTGKLNDVIAGLGRNEEVSLKEYIKSCRQFRCVIGQGAIGKQIDAFVTAGDPQAARWLALIFSLEWIHNAGIIQALAPFRATIIGNPAFKGAIDLNAATRARGIAVAARETNQNAMTELSTFIEEKTSSISELEQLFRQKLVIDEPAKFWHSVANSKRNGWKTWLAIFSALVVAPVLIVLYFWHTVAEAIMQITAASGGGFSVAGLAVVSIPALLYAWLLKNVSRIFLQNLALSDDASHRHALAITYLGLAENKKLQISDTDRALILNALFRAIPPHSADDGPPMGLIDLISKKP
jgi:hypothetical protein